MTKSVYHYNTTVRERDLDMLGHVNHANYFTLFEEARWEMLRENGISWRTIPETGIAPVIVDMNIKFKREITSQDQIVILTEILERKNPMVARMRQRMLKNDLLASELHLTTALICMNSRKLMNPPKRWEQIFLKDH